MSTNEYSIVLRFCTFSSVIFTNTFKLFQNNSPNRVYRVLNGPIMQILPIFLMSSPGATEPGVHASDYADDLLSTLPRYGLCQTLRQLLQQRLEGLSGQPGGPRHRVASLGRSDDKRVYSSGLNTWIKHDIR